jgi:hypothetical protein
MAVEWLLQSDTLIASSPSSQSHLQYRLEGRIQMYMREYGHTKSCHYALTAVPNNIPFQLLPISMYPNSSASFLLTIPNPLLNPNPSPTP